jgi:hypothetical protein
LSLIYRTSPNCVKAISDHIIEMMISSSEQLQIEKKRSLLHCKN